MSERLTIRTPEGIAFSHVLAGPVSRCLAWIVDLCVIALLGSVVGMIFKKLGLLNQDVAAAFATLSYFGIGIGYGIGTEWYWRGQTLGKRLLRLRVIDRQGLHLQFNQILIRNLLRFVDSLPVFYLVGGAACFLSPRCQRLGDLAAATLVIRIPRVTEPDLEQLQAVPYNSLREQPHLAARLRQRIDAPLAALLLQSIFRREEFEPVERVRLFAELAGYLRTLVQFPPETVESLSDEQYVRNVLDMVFR